MPDSDPMGLCVWFTGLSGSGKTTTAVALRDRLCGLVRCSILIDGDDVRRRSAVPIGFSRPDREAHVEQIGLLAAEAVVRGDVAICAVISPYRDARQRCRVLIGPERFVEVFVSTPLEICEERDPKGLYARVRRGEIAHFTGIDDPYEPPAAADVTIDTVTTSASDNADIIVDHLVSRGLLCASCDTSGVSRRKPARTIQM